jgi:phosphatidylglycerophosphate synthase
MTRLTYSYQSSDVLYLLASIFVTLLRVAVALFTAVTVLTVPVLGGTFATEAILFIVIADIIDGKLFDRSVFSEERRLRIIRRIVDSIADRLVIQMICIPIALSHHEFLWIYCTIAVREVSVSSYAGNQLTKRLLVYPGPIAKIACTLVAAVTILFLVAPGSVVSIAVFAMLIMSVLAIWEYRIKISRDRPVGAQNSSTITEVY